MSTAADWSTAVVALSSAMVGGIGATFGSRWATRKDLLERNRHALHLEELPAARRATQHYLLGVDTHGLAAVDQLDTYVAAVDQVVARSRLLRDAERQLGERLEQQVRKLEGDVGDMQLSSIDRIDLASEPWATALAEIAGTLTQNARRRAAGTLIRGSSDGMAAG